MLWDKLQIAGFNKKGRPESAEQRITQEGERARIISEHEMKCPWENLNNTLQRGSKDWKGDIALEFCIVGGVSHVRYPGIYFISMKSDTVLLAHLHHCCIRVLHCVPTIRCHHSTAVDFWGDKSRKSGLILQMQYFFLKGSQATPTKGSSWVMS